MNQGASTELKNLRKAIASTRDNRSSYMFLAPDEVSNPRHGENNLVIAIDGDEKIELDYDHKNSKFFKVNQL